jgi:two-component system nitrogen regulation response regulator NtrX
VSYRVLVVDDEGSIRDALRQVLEYEGWKVKTAASGSAGILACQEFRPHVVLLDVKMAGMDGLATLTRLRELDPPATVVMISGHGTIATAVEATRLGAYDFLEKPLDADRLLVTLRNAQQQGELDAQNRALRQAVGGRYQMVGTSSAMQEVQALIQRVGPTHSRVLIRGENGSGKELVARALHEASPRRDRPFVEVNCAAIPSELIESELFGHMKGSFTGATSDRAGKFELADGGTLFLDEVGDMAAPAQAKVLRVLQEGEVTRIGATKSLAVDVRVLAATNKPLEREIAARRFREDLFHRLNVIPIQVPALRERRQDIPQLVEHFVARLAESAGVKPRDFAEDALKALAERSWPGNVRELRNAVERLLILAKGSVISGQDVERLLPVTPLVDVTDYATFMEEAERSYLIAKLQISGWNLSDTARAIKLARSSLHKRMERLGLIKPEESKGMP